MDECRVAKVARGQEEGALEVGEVSFVSPLFLVKKRGPRKWRLVVDMRLLNTDLPTRKCRFEGIAVILQVVQRGWWFVTIDLKDGYHHVMMEPESRRFLGVCWRGVVRRFTVLVFGLNCAPWVFTKLVRVLLARWRALGIVVTAWLDDIVVAAPTEEKLVSALKQCAHTWPNLAGLCMRRKFALRQRKWGRFVVLY